ncbi:MAG: gliding motility-associated protein GldE, partial [Chitinophagaceae bacterium]|nr:gliding motility-associated protein GldE [Chitinophagaceae bacterium]
MESDNPLSFLNIFLFSPFNFDTQGYFIWLFVSLLFLLCCGLISGAELAFFSLNSKDNAYIKQKDSAAFSNVIRLLENPQKLITTIWIANHFFALGFIFTFYLISFSFIQTQQWFSALNPALASFLSHFIPLLTIGFLLLFFGEILPKVYASKNNIRMVVFSSGLLILFGKIFQPLSNIMMLMSEKIENKLSNHQEKISVEEFDNAVEITAIDASEEEKNILKGIRRFSDTITKQIMKNRIDIIAVEKNMPFAEVKKQIELHGYSRMPVYENTMDHVVGILHTKDLLPHIDKDDFDISSVYHSVFFVHESKPIQDLLTEFQQKRKHLAMVVDEFGGTSGIVTLEDVMEEIVGELNDEFDNDELEAQKIDNRNFIFEGKVLINDACRFMQMPLETFDAVKGESDSM